MTKIYTIGFSGKKNADIFMEILTAAGIEKLIDIRLWRTARFVPWANESNLKNTLGDKYIPMLELAPKKELLNAYKNGEIDWNGYKQIFNQILSDRKVEKMFTAESLDKVCFLCSEKTAEKCHRRLVAEYLQKHFLCEVIHL